MKVVSNSLGLVDFPFGWADFRGHSLDRQAWLEFFMACSTVDWTLGSVQNSYRQMKLKYRLLKGPARIRIFVALWSPLLSLSNSLGTPLMQPVPHCTQYFNFLSQYFSFPIPPLLPFRIGSLVCLRRLYHATIQHEMWHEDDFVCCSGLFFSHDDGFRSI